MLIEIILALIIGIIAGLISGLLPGIHINLVITFILGTSLITQTLSIPIVIFIVALSFTHILIDFIPTTLLGIPTEENYLSAQPAHKLVKQGLAHQAIKIAFFGVLISIPLMIVLFPIYAFTLPSIFQIIQKIIPYALLGMSIYLVFKEKNILAGMFIFFISGIIGFLSFNLPVKEPLLPLLSGLFGISSLFLGIFQEVNIPKQKILNVKINKKQFIKPTIASFFISPILSFFPGIGAGHISLFSSEIINPSGKQFIFLNSISSSLNMFLSIIAAYSIGKTRTGTSAAIKEILNPFSFSILILIAFSCIITILIAYFLGNIIVTKLIFIYNKISYVSISIITILFVVLLNILISNSLGCVILVSSTFIGIICQMMKIKKIQLMGALLLPTILYYFV